MIYLRFSRSLIYIFKCNVIMNSEHKFNMKLKILFPVLKHIFSYIKQDRTNFCLDCYYINLSILFLIPSSSWVLTTFICMWSTCTESFTGKQEDLQFNASSKWLRGFSRKEHWLLVGHCLVLWWELNAHHWHRRPW